jgi:Xaa-Pro aminopeptidase
MIQSGPNAAVPHNPTGERALQEGDAIVVDSVIRVDGYNNDLTRTYALGAPSPRAKEAYKAVRKAQAAAIDAARPGVECGELDRIARQVITEAGFGEYFLHRLGHGMGIECHEPPYLVGGNTEKLRAGMCMSVEPGIYARGEFGIRIEDDILISDDGCEVIRGELPTDVTAAFDG